MGLTEQLKDVLYDCGADLVGIGDISKVENSDFNVGIAIAAALPKNVIIDLRTAPTKEYYDLYYSLNRKLNDIVTAGENYLLSLGYEAYAQTTDRVKINQDRATAIPHKTVATRAGLGWIGKNCLLVTSQYGPAVRISSLLTNAPLECNKAIDVSRCGECRVCVEHCPARALKGTLWNTGVQREDIVNVEECYKKQNEIMYEHTGIEKDLCGKCFAMCVYDQKHCTQ